MTDEAVSDFLQHHGVKGMHWGIRGTRRVQKRADRLNRVASGKASFADKALAANQFVFTQKGANKQLQRAANNQAKIRAGKMKVANIITTASGIKIKDVNFHRKGDANAKLDTGQKVAVAVVGTLLIANGARTLANLKNL